MFFFYYKTLIGHISPSNCNLTYLTPPTPWVQQLLMKSVKNGEFCPFWQNYTVFYQITHVIVYFFTSEPQSAILPSECTLTDLLPTTPCHSAKVLSLCLLQNWLCLLIFAIKKLHPPVISAPRQWREPSIYMSLYIGKVQIMALNQDTRIVLFTLCITKEVYNHRILVSQKTIYKTYMHGQYVCEKELSYGYILP